MAIRVSSYLIAKTLSPFCLFTDDEYVKLMKLHINNTSILTDLLNEYIKPHFKEYDDESQETIKHSLSYFMKSNAINLEQLFDAFQIPFDPPEDEVKFLKILWSVLFVGEQVDDHSVSDYVVDNNQEFVNSLYKNGYR